MSPRISNSAAIILIIFAVAIDISEVFIELMLGLMFMGFVIIWLINMGMTVALQIVFRFFFKIDFTAIKTVIFFGLSFLEFLPVINLLPLWTVNVVATVLFIRIEDRLKESVASAGFGNNPQVQKAKGAIMRYDNRVSARQVRLGQGSRNAAENSQGKSRNLATGSRPTNVIDGNNAFTSNHPDPRVSEQRQAKLNRQNANNNEQKLAA